MSDLDVEATLNELRDAGWRIEKNEYWKTSSRESMKAAPR